MNKSIMSEEAFDELINGFEYVKNLTKYGKENIKYHVQKLQQENKILKENAENNDKVVDKVNWENMLLKKENKQLKDNWNKLKKYLENKIDEYSINLEYLSAERITQIKNKMQELEPRTRK